MYNKTLEQLDFFRIRNTIAKNCMSQEGIEFLEQRIPFTSLPEISVWKKQTAEWMKYISSGSPSVLQGWEPVGELFHILGVEGSTLEQEDIYALGTFCRSCSRIKNKFVFNDELPDTPELCTFVEKIPDLSEAEQKIFRIITKDGEVRDLPEIQAIRSSIQNLRQNIDTLMHHYTSDANLSKTLQSTLPALRGNRQVLAVKANFKGRIKGIVHEMSQTGQTLYIEPSDVVQKNNELIQEEFRLTQEIHRIFKELTTELGEYKKSFEKALQLMLHVDATYAAARWGVNNKCVIAQDINTSEKALTLLAARHPLLGSKAVPITVQFHPQHRVLILTGPNTGGKTVTLKTIALFTLLNQSAFPVPASEGTILPIFTNIFADIGDEQSLDQSLSTFSGHMKNIAQAIKGADENSLVLLDELGSGTDPQEGGAIAMAVLDELIKRDSFVLVTTHHGILKNFGYTHKSCVNASVDFDETTLSPTYRIQMGVPGESHALDIARRSGLNSEIVEMAEKYITDGDTNVSKLIKGLNQKHEELAELQKKYRIKEYQINEKWREVDLKDLQLRQKELDLQKEGYRNNREFLETSRKKLENLVRELREGEITREKNLKVKQTIADMNNAVEKQQEELTTSYNTIADFTQYVAKQQQIAQKNRKSIAEQSNHTVKAKTKQRKNKKRKISFNDLKGPSLEQKSSLATFTLKRGAAVLVGEKRRKGILLEEGKKGSWIVQVGSLKMTIKNTELFPDWEATQKQGLSNTENSKEINPSTTHINYVLEKQSNSNDEKPQFELRLLGMHYEEAMKALEHQLDLCTIHSFKNFSIVHGKGTGVLQQGVQDYLSHYPGIKEFHFARPEQGGTGKTFVELNT
ncbi:MAG: hypothetical protein BKP49_08855 [Treponema sp. CETP13]|nr:MAG: hypothetical protein BKP49_08855 [Treponema sp. CETP13]